MKKSNFFFLAITVLVVLFAVACTSDPVLPKTEVNSEESLNKAIADNDESLIVLTDNINLESPLTIGFGKKVTLDLNGKTIKNEKGNAILVRGGNLTIEGDGTVDAKSTAVMAMDDGKTTIESGKFNGTFAVAAGYYNSDTKEFSNGSVVINDGEFTSQEFTVPVWGKSSAVINGGTFTAKDNAVIGTNGSSPLKDQPYSIVINGGTFNGHITSKGYIACGIYMANSGEVTLNGGTFNIEGGIGVLVRSGELTANKAEVSLTAKEGLSSGKVGDSNIVISAGKSQIVVDNKAGYPGNAPKVVVNTTGYVVKDPDGNDYVELLH